MTASVAQPPRHEQRQSMQRLERQGAPVLLGDLYLLRHGEGLRELVHAVAVSVYVYLVTPLPRARPLNTREVRMTLDLVGSLRFCCRVHTHSSRSRGRARGGGCLHRGLVPVSSRGRSLIATKREVAQRQHCTCPHHAHAYPQILTMSGRRGDDGGGWTKVGT